MLKAQTCTSRLNLSYRLRKGVIVTDADLDFSVAEWVFLLILLALAVMILGTVVMQQLNSIPTLPLQPTPTLEDSILQARGWMKEVSAWPR